MNPVNQSSLNLTYGTGHAYQYSLPDYDPVYKGYKTPSRELFPLPKAVLYLLMVALVVVAIAYAIVGHLIKDIARDFADCALGPDEEDRAKDLELQCINTTQIPEPHQGSQSSTWDQDRVAIVLSTGESQQRSPRLPNSAPYTCSSFDEHKSARASSGPGNWPLAFMQDLESDLG